MKHIKSFNQINESELWNIFNGQNKTYMDLDEDEYDNIIDELGSKLGRKEVTDMEKSKIGRILNFYLRTEVTGMKISKIDQRFPHSIHLWYEGCIVKPCDFSVYCYNDDYFAVTMKIPVSTPSGNKTQYIVMEEFFYVIDGWDGLEEWAEKTSPYTQNQEIYKLLKSPLKELSPTDYIEVSNGLLNNLMKNYPYIRGWGARTFYFFDPSRGGEYFCRVEIRGTTKQKEYYYDDGTLLDDGTRSRKPSNK